MNLTTILQIIIKIALYGIVAWIVFLILKAAYPLFKPLIDELKPLLKKKKETNKDDPENVKAKIKDLEEQVEKYKALEKYSKDKKALEIKLNEINLKLRKLKEKKK